MWDMIRDVLVTSMNKAQLPALAVAVLLGMCIWKMPPADVSRLIFEIKSDLVNAHLLGYVLTVVVTLGWFLTAKAQRRTIYPEIDRIGSEKSKLQKLQLGEDLESSGS